MTEIIEYKFIDRSERMDLIMDGDFERYFNALELASDERRRIARVLMYAAYLHGCVKICKEGSQWHYLHRAWKYGDHLQFTTWDEEGPVSDLMIVKDRDFSHYMTGTIKAYVEEEQ